MQKPDESAIWNFLQKCAFLSYIYVQLFHFNYIEKELYISITIQLLNLIGGW